MINYSEPKINANGGKAIYVNYDEKVLFLQTPKMSCPFGLSAFDAGDYTKYSLDLSFNGMDGEGKNCEAMKDFYDKMDAFDSKLVQDAVKNSQPWFKKKKTSLEVCKALYNPQIRLSKDKETGEPNGQYPPTFKVKMPNRDGRFTSDVFDLDRKKVANEDLESYLVKGSQVQALIQCVGIWVVDGKFGCNWKVQQLRVWPPKGLSGYSFLPDSDDDELDESDDSEDEVEDSDLED